MNASIKDEIRELLETAKSVYISSVNEAGYPNTKAVFTLSSEGIATHYFSSNLSARRTGQYLQNPKACIYFCRETDFQGLMLVGRMQVLTDRAHKARLWREGYEIYYPKGIDDEDYCILKFTAAHGNYYHGPVNHSFTVEEALSWNI